MKKMSERIKKLAIKLGCDYETAEFIILETKRLLDSEEKKN